MRALPETARLPLQLRPSQSTGLIRLGSPTDGGYIIRKADVLASEGLISMGIDRNWTFERQFVRLKSVPVHAYDGCTDTRYLLGDLRQALRYRNPRWIATSLARALDYHWFFSGRKKHFRQFVGTDTFAYQKSGSETVPFDSVVSALPGRLFLKIDIEGAEFGILDGLFKHAGRTTGLAIEFHDCDDHLEEIVSFVERYPLALIHTHANSYSKLGPRGVPDALELTFSSTARTPSPPAILPHPLDAPNDGRAEIPLQFAPLNQDRQGRPSPQD